MKHKSFIAGFVSGAILFGSSGAYAAGILAVPSEQEVFVNGKKADITGYNIEGNNYFRLRDLGNAVDFPVDYDADNDCIIIGGDAKAPELNNKKSQIDKTDQTENHLQTVNVSVQYGSDGRPLSYEAKPGSVLYGTGNVSKAVNPYAASEYDGYMTIKAYSRGVPFPTEPLKAINPRWDNSYYKIEMPNPMPCYSHILAGESSTFLGMEVEGASEQYNMYVFNAHETQRIIDELYDTFLEHPACYTDGKLNCTVRVGLTASGFESNYFYPYQEHCVEQTVGDRNIEYMVYAVDTYTNGVFMGTKYCCIPNCSPDNPDVISSDTAIMKDRQYR